MKVLIVGAGLAAQRCCAALRRLGHDGPITVLGDEPQLPYDRPPLSKEWLAGSSDAAALQLRPPSWYDAHGIAVRTATAAVGLDVAGRRVALADGTRERYDRLLVATGARARMLPGCARADDVHALRSAADAIALRAQLRPGTQLVVAGAGFVGLEVAATARALGVAVTVVDPARAPLERIVGARLGGWLAQLHRDEGVDLRLGGAIAELLRARGRVRAVRLAGGERLACDALLVAIGAAPATGWLRGTPLAGAGVAVDGAGRSAVANVFAAGDAARPLDPRSGRHERSGHWEAAGRLAVAAAHAMLGLQPPPATADGFWSDQHGTRIQLLGDPRAADDVRIDGDPSARDLRALYLRGGRVVAGLLVGRPRALPALRTLIDHPHHDGSPT